MRDWGACQIEGPAPADDDDDDDDEEEDVEAERKGIDGSLRVILVS